ncbi:Hypothetical protein, putative [Bodo saltans]|uniref:Uncharacterized protein n=1 Tax=Bodo saltans TaxID=75058 RepID=A0A0S4J1H4_BODSA|nr:Hypothetical protein, putative [Bodo saltans]|eukprot:CUG81754.1 Hypothetical protein, putative [Bodo saltans]
MNTGRGSRTPSTGIVSPSFHDDGVSVASSHSTNAPADAATVQALQERNQALVAALINLSEEHKDVTMRYATLLRRMDSMTETTSTATAKLPLDTECPQCAHDKGMLTTLTTVLEELATTVETLKQEKGELVAALEHSKEVNDTLASYVARLEITNDTLSLELDALVKHRPQALASRAPEAAVPEASEGPSYVYGEDILRAATASTEEMTLWPTINSYIASADERGIEDRANAILLKGQWLRDHCKPKSNKRVQ